MEPQQLAALLGTEVDAGFAAALSRLGASRALVVDTIRTRVGAVPHDVSTEPVDWSQIPWLADITLQPVAALPATAGQSGPTEPSESAGGSSTHQRELHHHLAALPVAAVRGIGSTWASRLRDWGIAHVGDLAVADPGELMRRAGGHIPGLVVLLARARVLVAPWPDGLAAGHGRSIAALAMSAPTRSDVAGFVLRDHCMGLLACLDLDVAGAVGVP